MAIFQAASVLLSAAVEAAALVWMELAMFGLAAVCYLFFVGIPGWGASRGTEHKGKGTKKTLQISSKTAPCDSKSSPRHGSETLALWESTKGSAEAGSSLDLPAVVHAMRNIGKTIAEVVAELRAALDANPALLPSFTALPRTLLRDDAVDMLDSVLELLEGRGLAADATIYSGLMAAQLRRRNYARVAATGGRVPKDAMTLRMLAILASAAAQRGCADEALMHVRQMPVPEDCEKSPLAGLVAMQIIAAAAKEKCMDGALEEMQRVRVQLENKQFEEFVASQGRRLSEDVLDEVLAGGLSLGISAEFGRSTISKARSQLGRSSGSGSGELQRCAGMIKSHAKEGNLDAAVAAFEHLRSTGTALTPMIFNCFLDACVQCRDFGRAASHFEEMKRLEVVDTVGYNTMLKAHLHRGHTEDARDLVKEMKERGFAANKVTYNEMLHSKVMAKDRRGMWALVEEMQVAGLQPDSVACSIMLKSLVSYSHASDAKRVLDFVERLGDSVDDVLFSSVIEACIRIEQLGLLSDFMRHCRKRGARMSLSSPTYGSMIKAYGQAGDAERVRELWAEMREHGVKPSSITLGCLTEALVVNGRGQEAWDLVREQMQSEETRGHINTVIYSTVLKGFAVTKDMEKTFAVYDEMRSHGIACNTITYNTILDSCAKGHAMSRASKLLEDMSATSVEPDIITYSTILKGYCVEGDLDRAFHILEEMKKDGKLQADEIMYNSILDGCAKQHRTEDAMRIFEEMKSNRISPSNYTLSILVKVLGHARRLGHAFEMLETLSKQYSFRPNVQVYTCLVQACVHNRRLDRALALHDTMVADVGCSVDEKFYSVLVRGCLQMREPLKAVEVIRAACQLPGHSLARSARRDGRPVGVEAKILQEVAAKLQGGSRTEKVWSQLSADLEKSGVRPSVGSGRSDGRVAGGQRGRYQ